MDSKHPDPQTSTPKRRRQLLAALALHLALAPALLAQSSATLRSEDLTQPIDRYQPGDRVRYTATVHPEAYNDLVQYEAIPPAALRLRPGTVTTTQRGRLRVTNLAQEGLIVGSVSTSVGRVVRGNTPGDTTIEVSLEGMPVFSTATVRFNAQAVSPILYCRCLQSSEFWR